MAPRARRRALSTDGPIARAACGRGAINCLPTTAAAGPTVGVSRCGWRSFRRPLQRRLGVFEVDRFGAKPDDGQDDAAAIQQAIDAAAKAGGGTSASPPASITSGDAPPARRAGRRHPSVGAGMGKYDAKTQTVPAAAPRSASCPALDAQPAEPRRPLRRPPWTRRRSTMPGAGRLPLQFASRPYGDRRP